MTVRLLAMGALAVSGLAAPGLAAVGDTREIVLTRDSSFTVGSQGTGSSHDQDAIIERVIRESDAGVELEYDRPKAATKDERAEVWQLPARILRHPDGSMQLLNEGELQARADKWLKSAHWTREVCGHLIFTWNAFRIECDPQSAIRIVQDFDLGRSPISEGAYYRDPAALQAGALVRKPGPDGGAIYSVELPVDPEQIRREGVETDLGVAEISGKPLERAEAVRNHAAEQISGTISVAFEANATGEVWRRTRVTRIEIKQPGGSVEHRQTTETLESRLLPAR
jgi:hypothetical protein